MHIREIKTKQIKISLYDTGRCKQASLLIDDKKFKSGLVKIMNALSDLLWGRGKNSLKLGNRGIKKAHLSMTLCGDKRIQSLNSDYRQKNKKTDVLSFPLHESLRFPSDDIIDPMGGGIIELGDIFICKEVAIRQAKEFQISFAEEIYHLLVHGALHLIGYDHEISAKEEKLMFSLEEKVLKRAFPSTKAKK
jgi:probable rRNA maturation factor